MNAHMFSIQRLIAHPRILFAAQMALAHFITKVMFKPLILSSYVWTAVFWSLFLLLLRAIYALVLYPLIFSPFRHLPTPTKRTLLWGNGGPLFSEPPGAATRRFAETIPNEGLIRFYGFLCQERVLVTSPKGFSELLVQHGYHFTKTFQLKYQISRITGQGLGYSEGDEHKIQRKHLMPAFSYRHIKNLTPIFWNKGIEMVECIEKELSSSASTNVIVRDWASRVTLDIIGVAGMDHDFQALKHPNNQLNEIYRKLFTPPSKKMKILGQIGYFIDPTILQMLPVPRHKTIEECSAYIRTVTKDIIEQKKEKSQMERSQQVDIIGVALDSGVFTEENLVDQMMTFLAAGHETTATSLQWTIWTLCQFPEIQTRLREEVRAHLPSISADVPTTPDAATVDSLPYLNAVCSEVLRFHPPVPMTLREALIDTVVLGTFIPRGTIMVISAAATNHSTELWGPNAAEFNPERWMAEGKANSGGATSNYAFMTFIHGPRSCIGSAFTKSELACLTAILIGRFKFELANPDEKLELDVGVTVAPKGGVAVKIEVVEGW